VAKSVIGSLARDVRVAALLATLFLASLLAVAPRSAIAQGNPGPNLERPVRGYAKHRVLLQTRVGLSERELDKILAKHGGRKKQFIRQIRVHVIELPERAAELAVARALRSEALVKFAELDMSIAPALVPNDTFYVQAWHLPKIGAPQAWDISTGAGVVIAILDTGVNVAHPDLAGRAVPGWNVFNNNSDTADVYGHGTKVAGTAMAAGNNGIGVTGVGFAAKVMPVRISDLDGYAFFSDMAEGIVWAADHGARVANISYQGAAGSSSVQSAAQYLRSKGGVVVVSAGNTGGAQEIAANTNVIAVSATDSADQRPSWSSYGGYVDIAAPGVSVMTTTSTGGYGGFSGTSASAPVVAGTYALMMTANPGLGPFDLDQVLFATAVDLGSAGKDIYFGAGRVDAGAAVVAATQGSASDSIPPTVSIQSPTAGSKVEGVVPVDVMATDNVAVARVELYANGTLVATDVEAPYAFAWDVSGLSDGEVTLTARAFDTAGNQASATPVKVTVGNDITPPKVLITNPLSGSQVTGVVNVTVTATDDKKVSGITLSIDGREVARSDGASLSYAWDTSVGTKGGKGGGKGGGGNKGGGSASGKKGATSATGTTSSLTARATDPAGNVGSASAIVTRY